MFKYRLEPVLGLKEKLEENKKRELGLAHQYYEEVKKEQHQLVKEKERAYEEARNQINEKVDVNQLKQLNHYAHYIEKAIKLKTKELDLAAKEVEQKREELIEAVKERKILGNLKEIHLEEYKEEEKRIQNSIVDEIVSYKYSAGQKE